MLRKSARILEQTASSTPAPSLPASNSNTEVMEELRRIVESPEFAGSERGRTLLTYLVENALGGGVDRLKERTIGIEIFGRDATYDTGQDAIVRVSANSIRKRLATYYSRIASAGEHPDLRIFLAPGSYTPEFLIEPGATAPVEEPPKATERPPRRWVLPAIVAVLVLVCLALGLQNWRLRIEAAALLPAPVLPWSMFKGHKEARIALTDSNVTLHKLFTQREMTLTEYTAASWLTDLKSRSPGAFPLAGMAYTSVASAVTAARVGSVLAGLGTTALIGSSRNFQLRDFKEDRPIVLLGSTHADPWVELFEDRLNFVIDNDAGRHAQLCLNKAPRTGEEPRYVAVGTMDAQGTAYAIVSVLPNLAGRAPVLIIAGTNAQATEAAGEVAADIPRMARELRNLGIDPHGKFSQLELLIRVRHVNQEPSRSEVIAHRVTR